jgi:hypothetical protein
MEKEFIPYEQALALKELGFDEPCFGRYDSLKVLVTISRPKSNSYYKGSVPSFLATPLYQQVFRWFRENHSIFSSVDVNYRYKIYVNDEFFEESITYNSHEEAGLECLKKLIEIVKNNGN